MYEIVVNNYFCRVASNNSSINEHKNNKVK